MVLLVYSCSSNPVGPEIIKDPKQYVWSVDTLRFNDPTMIQSILGSIWGSSEKDVYAVGHGDAGNPIMHYDGQSWTDMDKTKNGIKLSYRAEWVYGFGGNDVWITGWAQAEYGSIYFPDNVGSIIHFNGSSWTQYDLPFKTMSFEYIWGKNSSDLWACGSNGIVAHYINSKWGLDTIQIVEGSTGNFWIRGIVDYNNVTYAIGFKNPRNYFFRKDGNTWVQIDSFVDVENAKWGDRQLFVTQGNKLWTYGNGGIWEMENNSWSKIINTEESVSGISEYVKNKFIIIDYYGKVYTYSDGILELLKDFGANPYLAGIWANNKECFILANKIGSGISASSLVYHGK